MLLQETQSQARIYNACREYLLLLLKETETDEDSSLWQRKTARDLQDSEPN